MRIGAGRGCRLRHGGLRQHRSPPIPHQAARGATLEVWGRGLGTPSMCALASCPILAEMTTILDDALVGDLAGQVDNIAIREG